MYQQEGGHPGTDEASSKKTKATDKLQKLTDGGGLFLLVHPNGGKYWRMAYRFAGKQKTLAIGVYPDISLSEARDRREQARKLLANDADPRPVVISVVSPRGTEGEADNSASSLLDSRLRTFSGTVWHC